MTLDLAARLAVLLACAVAAGVLYVRLAGPRPALAGPGGDVPSAGSRGASRPIAGAVGAALGAFVVVAGGAALTGIGMGAGEGMAFTLLRAAGIVALVVAGLLALVPLPGRGKLGEPALVGLAWIGAGMALVAPLVLLVAAIVVVLLAVRVTDRPPT